MVNLARCIFGISTSAPQRRNRRANRVGSEALESRTLLTAGVLDVDGDGAALPLSDGIVLMRMLAGFSGEQLVDGAVDADAETVADIAASLDENRGLFDFDQDGSVHALTDGVLALRYMAGFRGASVTAGIVAESDLPVGQIESSLELLMPQTASISSQISADVANSEDVSEATTDDSVVMPETEVSTSAATLEEMLDELGIEIDEGDSPKIEADVDNQVAEISSLPSGDLQLTLNGMTHTISIEDDLEIKISGMGNRLTIRDAVIPDDLTLKIRGTDNVVDVINTEIGDDLKFEGSDGTEGLILDYVAVGDNIKIKTKDGADGIGITDVMVGNDIEISMSDGDDMLGLENVSVGEDLKVNMGDDDDVVSLNNVFVDDDADVEGDDDRDLLATQNVRADDWDADDFEGSTAIADIDQVINDLTGMLGL